MESTQSHREFVFQKKQSLSLKDESNESWLIKYDFEYDMKQLMETRFSYPDFCSWGDQDTSQISTLFNWQQASAIWSRLINKSTYALYQVKKEKEKEKEKVPARSIEAHHSNLQSHLKALASVREGKAVKWFELLCIHSRRFLVLCVGFISSIRSK